MRAPVDAGDLDRSISERFDDIAEEQPDRTAIRATRAATSYAQLRARSDAVARRVLEHGAHGGPCPVAVALPQGAGAIAAQLGILRAGAFYVPADANGPVARLRELVAHVGARIVISDGARAPALRGSLAGYVEVFGIDDIPELEDGSLRAPYPDPDALAYVYYTSGSTGAPKGVADTHRNVMHNVLRYTRGLSITSNDRLTLLQPPSFSAVVSSTYAALLNGGTLLAYDLFEDGPAGLAQFIADNRATIYHSVPAIFRNLVAGRTQFPAMRYLRLEGDRALGRDARLFQEHFAPGCRLVNGLGTTETGLVCQYFVTHETIVDDGPLPIGHAVSDVECIVVDAEGAPVADGEVGEIAVESNYLARGYWNDDALTRRKFEQRGQARRYRTGDFGRMRADGCLEYLGRSEAEPRVRGTTLDRAELERALLRLADVTDAAVTTTSDADGDPVVVAAVAARAGSAMSAASLRDALRPHLRERAIPARFVICDSLPLTAFGKIDRSAIARMADAAFDAVAHESQGARDPIEARVAGIWREVLGAGGVDATRPFLDHGGDSLQAMRILTRINEAFGVDLSPRRFFALPTIEDQAAFLREAATDSSSAEG